MIIKLEREEICNGRMAINGLLNLMRLKLNFVRFELIKVVFY